MDYDWLNDVPGAFPKQPRKAKPTKDRTTARTKERRAEKRQLETIYQRNKKKAARRDGKTCRCGCGETDISTHHKVKRGMAGGNRDDRIENLVTLGRLTCHPKADSGALDLEFLNQKKGANGRIRFTSDSRTWITNPVNEVSK